MSKPFPYSILAFSDEAEDQGKALRASVAKFESQYDVFRYSIDRYWDKIGIPIILHQGTADEAVPYWWSDQLAKELTERDKTIIYHRYLGADHNLRPSWETVVARDLEFLQSLK